MQRLDGEIGRIQARQDVKDKLSQLDNVVAPGNAAQFGKLLKDEAAANERVIREAGIKLE